MTLVGISVAQMTGSKSSKSDSRAKYFRVAAGSAVHGMSVVTVRGKRYSLAVSGVVAITDSSKQEFESANVLPPAGCGPLAYGHAFAPPLEH